MKHTIIDCYGGNQHQLDDIKLINQILTDITYRININPICPPNIVPYYYGKVKEDIGISAYVLLDGGHITIHTFPIRECYFVDIFYSKDFDERKFYKFFLEKLPFEERISNVQTIMRDQQRFEILPYDQQSDFGPHLMSQIKTSTRPNMELFFDFLENMVDEIGMDPITRANVLKDHVVNPTYLSGIIVIAQSHIALHYEFATGNIYADIFSCAPFDYTTVEECLKKLGELVSNELLARGTKHIYKVKSNVSNDELLASTKWQKVIHK